MYVSQFLIQINERDLPEIHPIKTVLQRYIKQCMYQQHHQKTH